jgi:hypothetical protein
MSKFTDKCTLEAYVKWNEPIGDAIFQSKEWEEVQRKHPTDRDGWTLDGTHGPELKMEAWNMMSLTKKINILTIAVEKSRATHEANVTKITELQRIVIEGEKQ